MFFELDDVRRRHNPDWHSDNVTSWHKAVDSKGTWNFQRGWMVGITACTIQQYITNFILHGKAMLRNYQPPINLSQWWIFLRETRKLDSFKAHFKSRLQYGIMSGFLSVGTSVALLRTFNNGWSDTFNGVQYTYYRKLPTFMAAAVLSSPFGVLVDMVQRAYEADGTFPKQLQKGYKSYLHAFLRIPFEQGPYYLFKNTFPLFGKHIIGPFTAFYSYDFTLDKLSLLWRINSVPVLPVQLFSASLAAILGTVFSYQFAHSIREIVDLWPRAKGGIDPYEGNYRKAAVVLFFSASNDGFAGIFKVYFWHYFPQWLMILLFADKMGIFRYWRVSSMSGPGANCVDDAFV